MLTIGSHIADEDAALYEAESESFFWAYHWRLVLNGLPFR